MNNKVKIKVTGKNPDYFLKEIIRRNINIYNLEKQENTLNILLQYDDYKDLLKMKTTYKIKIINRYGLNKYKYLLKKYFHFILFSLLGIFINLFLSHIIFKVEIIHPNTKLVNIVSKDLEEFGLEKYHFKMSYQKKETIKEKILEKEKDLIEWLEIEEQGTKYIIKIEERKKNDNQITCPERHIVAKKNAMITEIKASSGEIVKKINDYVVKGEIIVSGLIYNKEDVVSKRCAVGEVYGETWYKVRVSVPKSYKEEKLLKNKTYGLSIIFFGKQYDLFQGLRTFQKKEYNILEGKIIPIRIGLAKYQETKIISKNYTTENIEKEALDLAEKKIKKTLEKNESIISKKVLKKQEIESKIEVEVFLKVKENITDYFEISDINIEEMNVEEE